MQERPLKSIFQVCIGFTSCYLVLWLVNGRSLQMFLKAKIELMDPENVWVQKSDNILSQIDLANSWKDLPMSSFKDKWQQKFYKSFGLTETGDQFLDPALPGNLNKQNSVIVAQKPEQTTSKDSKEIANPSIADKNSEPKDNRKVFLAKKIKAKPKNTSSLTQTFQNFVSRGCFPNPTKQSIEKSDPKCQTNVANKQSTDMNKSITEDQSSNLKLAILSQGKNQKVESLSKPNPPLRDLPKPLKILTIGDSVMGAIDMRLKTISRKKKLNVKVDSKWKVSSGLTRKFQYDWPKNFSSFLKRQKYDLVFVVFGSNEIMPLRVKGKRIPYGRKGWNEAYQKRVKSMFKIACKDKATFDANRKFVWVSNPPMGKSNIHEAALRINKLVQPIVKEFPNCAHWVDSGKVLGAGKTNTYRPYLTVNGSRRKIRHGDGVHFSSFGGELVAKHVLEYSLKNFFRTPQNLGSKTSQNLSH